MDDHRFGETPGNGLSRSRALLLALGSISLVGLGLSGYLMLHSLGKTSLAGCGSDSSCDIVLSSSWSSVFGVPVSVPAAGIYVTMLATLGILGTARTIHKQHFAWCVLLFLATSIAVAAVWFIVVQFAVIKQSCKFCMASHVLGLILFGMIWLNAPIRKRASEAAYIGMRDKMVIVLVSLVAVSVIAFGQVLSPAGTHRLVRYQEIQIRAEALPMIGSSHADRLLVTFFDYTCLHCRAFHRYLLEARDRYGDQIAFAVAFVPSHPDCNSNWSTATEEHRDACEYARLGLAVWTASPQKFERFERLVLKPEALPAINRARAIAEELVGPASLGDAMGDPKLLDRIRSHVSLNAAVGKRATSGGRPVGDKIPKLIITERDVLVGRPADADQLFGELERVLGIQPE